MCTPNVHSLIHLCASVRQLGPLWAYSCFGFENMNGMIKRDQHGCRNFLPSLTNAICMKISLSLHKNAVMKSNQESDKTKRFFEKNISLLEKSKLSHWMRVKSKSLEMQGSQFQKMDSNHVIHICLNIHHTKLERIQ